MKKKLFITGPANCGKSLLIRSVLGARMQGAGGFVTQNEYDENRNLCARILLPAAAAAGVEGLSSERFLDYTGKSPKSNNDVFRSLGTQLVQEAMYYPYAVLDGFGGTDLLIPQYRSALEILLNSELPCIGVIKSPEEIAQLKSDFHLTDRFIMLTDNLRSELSADDETVLIETFGKGDIKTLRIIQQWAKEYA